MLMTRMMYTDGTGDIPSLLRRRRHGNNPRSRELDVISDRCLYLCLRCLKSSPDSLQDSSGSLLSISFSASRQSGLGRLLRRQVSGVPAIGVVRRSLGILHGLLLALYFFKSELIPFANIPLPSFHLF
jgi:hypothetical protein